MELDHSFTVPVGVNEAWQALIDIERVAPCMPGAALDSVDGDEFTGTVKVKLGPINLTYKGKASFVEKDAGAHRAVIDARGRDARACRSRQPRRARRARRRARGLCRCDPRAFRQDWNAD